jgi:hypothetical protein
MARMSAISIPRAFTAAFSSGSIERMPNRLSCSCAIEARGSLPSRSSSPASPQRKAEDMPCMFPEGEIAGMLKSA